ncbi:MAG: EAL domain-containing protein [Caulobacterales bacterium]
MASSQLVRDNADLADALVDGRVTPYVQPVFRLADGKLAGFEALARWRHRKKGLLQAAPLISAAEAGGLMPALSELMVGASVDLLASWRRRFSAAQDIFMAVNVSGPEIADGSVLRQAAAAAKAAGLPPKALHIEITEHHVIDDHDAAAIALTELRASGVGVALDDFGAGFASLNWLARFPADILKIDAYFVKAMDDSPAAEKIIRAITALAHDLGLKVIAEGVESADGPNRLRELGCDYAQGHFYGEAIEPEEAEARYLIPAA